MLDSIKAFFEQCIAPDPQQGGQDHEHRTRLAVAALLMETLRMDRHLAKAEREQVQSSLVERFALGTEEAAALAALADAEVQEAVDLFQFTSHINRTFGVAEKIRLIELMWRVAFADGELHKYEDYLIRKVAELIHVPHKEFIAAKLRVAERRDGI